VALGGARQSAEQREVTPVVPSEAVGDRNPDAHKANLYDIDAKYGDVVPVRETLDYLEEVAAAHAR
jgi:maleamate amidohydrolase